MQRKQKIEKERNAAFRMEVGEEDDSEFDFLSTGRSLHVIRSKGVYKVIMPDHVDPGRSNPDIPPSSQKVISTGTEDPLVARILLTALTLYDERHHPVRPLVTEILEAYLKITQRLLDLRSTLADLLAEVEDNQSLIDAMVAKPGAAALPAIPEIDKKLDDLLTQANRIKNELFAVCFHRFLPGFTKRPTLDKLKPKALAIFEKDVESAACWSSFLEFQELITHLRNCVEHKKPGEQIILSDFKMQPDGTVAPPSLIFEHPKVPLEPMPLTMLGEFLFGMLTQWSEQLLLLIRRSELLERDGAIGNEWAAAVPDDLRRHPAVRFYRLIKLHDEWRILG